MSDLNTYWWEEKTEAINKTVFGIVRYLDQNQAHRQQANLRNMRLYGNLNVLGMTANTYSHANAVWNAFDRISLNIIQSCIDTVANRISKNKPKPTFLTFGGDYSLKKKAKLLDKYVQGQFYAMDIYNKGQKAFKAAEIFGTGAVKIYRDGNRICAENIFIDELQIDDSEAIYGEPRSIYQKKYIAREVLARMFPKFESQINAAPKADSENQTNRNLSNHVLVVEAWHLPSGKDAGDGKHVISIETATLVDEEYKKDYFPFAFLKWNTLPLGFFGQGLSEQLTGLQIEINKILRTIQLSFHLLGSPAVLIGSESKIVSAHLNNEIGRIIKFSGMPPTIWKDNPVANQLIEHLDRLYNRAFEIAGVSQLSAQSKKPSGLDSGRALREFNDIESERFMLVGQMYECFYLDIAKQIIELSKEIYEDDKDLSVMVKGKKFIEKIKWSEVDLEDDEYQMQVFPTSSLSQTPAGRLQDVQELIQAGFIDKAYALKLLDYPDLESFMSLANAAIEDIEETIEAMIDSGKYRGPEPFQDLVNGIKIMQSAYLKYKTEKVDQDRLELLIRWMSEADATLKSTLPPPAAPPLAGAPGANPMATPKSDLIPNVP